MLNVTTGRQNSGEPCCPSPGIKVRKSNLASLLVLSQKRKKSGRWHSFALICGSITQRFILTNLYHLEVSEGRDWASQMALVVKNLLSNAGDIRPASLILGSGRSPGGDPHDNPLPYSCLKNLTTGSLEE